MEEDLEHFLQWVVNGFNQACQVRIRFTTRVFCEKSVLCENRAYCQALAQVYESLPRVCAPLLWLFQGDSSQDDPEVH